MSERAVYKLAFAAWLFFTVVLIVWIPVLAWSLWRAY